jgi:hypothetical protein
MTTQWSKGEGGGVGATTQREGVYLTQKLREVLETRA